jgi:general secretion pathway protein D
LALADAEVPGWKRIVVNSKLSEIAVPAEDAAALERLGAAIPVTQAFPLKHAEPHAVEQAIKPFLSVPGAGCIAVKEPKVLIVTDYAANVQRIAQWIALVDRPQAQAGIEMRPLRHVEATALAQQITAILGAKAKAEGTPNGPGVEVTPEVRTNQLLIIGTREQTDKALQLADVLDVPLGVTTAVHPFRYVAAERVDRLIKGTIDPLAVKTLYKSTLEKDENQLIVTAPPDVHARIDELRRSLDVPASRAQSPIRFYEIKNTGALELLETLRSLKGERGAGSEQSAIQTPVPERPASQSIAMASAVPGGGTTTNGGTGAGSNGGNGAAFTTAEPQATAKAVSWNAGDAQITADPNTNSLVIVADPETQNAYAELIQKLDRRRPQVLIEAKLVVLDTSNDFSFGVDLSAHRNSALKNVLAFSSFGLSKVDPVSGALSVLPGLGFNGALLDPETADVAVRALSNHHRAKVLSAPKVLVNDNATGTLTSVAEVPFTSINASQTVATTSFAGFAKAGTTIVVTPHIAEGEHLQLHFRVTLNSFTGQGANGVPPPRQTDEVESRIDVPDGHTVIVGGLNRKSDSDTKASLPYIEKIPVVGNLLSNKNRSAESSSLFIFIRPVILREDKFKDLKFLSGGEAAQAGLGGEYPVSKPLLVR